MPSSPSLKKKAKALMDGGDAFFADELFTAAVEGKDEVQLVGHADGKL